MLPFIVCARTNTRVSHSGRIQPECQSEQTVNRTIPGTCCKRRVHMMKHVADKTAEIRLTFLRGGEHDCQSIITFEVLFTFTPAFTFCAP